MISDPGSCFRDSRIARYGLAVVSPLLAAAIRIALAPIFGDRMPLITFYPAIMATAWFGGLWPGVLSTIVSGAIAPSLGFEPVYLDWISHEGTIIAFVLFGYRRDEVMGKTVRDTIIPPRLRDAHWRDLRKFLETGKGRVTGRRIEMPAMRADGSEFPSELTI